MRIAAPFFAALVGGGAAFVPATPPPRSRALFAEAEPTSEFADDEPWCEPDEWRGPLSPADVERFRREHWQRRPLVRWVP